MLMFVATSVACLLPVQNPMHAVQDEQPVAALVALTQHLEGARYQQFWQAVDMCRDTLKIGEPCRTCCRGAGSADHLSAVRSRH